MINIPAEVKGYYKDFNREIKVYGNLYLATRTIENGEYVTSYTNFPLTETNGAEILSFTINEKADIYYSSVPGNSLTIELNNEQGYFTDYYQNNILDYLKLFF